MHRRFPIYESLINLYPKEYRNKYGTQMVQALADMVDDQPKPIGRAAIRLRADIDLPINIMYQNALSFGDDFMYKTPNYIKRNATISAALLVPFFVALTANTIDKIVNHHYLYRGWAWSVPILTTWALIMPSLAFILAFVTYMVYTASHKTSAPVLQRMFDVRHTWPVLLPGVCGLGILFILQFHDTAHCWVQNPTFFITKFHQTWQCTKNSYLGN